MGRVLEVLRQTGVNRSPTVEAAPAARVFKAVVDEGPMLDAGDEVPFIEVGGPGTSAATVSAPGTTSEVRGPVLASPITAAPHTHGPLQVTFRPLPATPPALKPACERFARELIAFHQPEHPVSEQYRTLLAAVESQLAADHAKVVLFTAPTWQAGCTTVLLNLALTRALRGGVRLVVLDTNLARAAVAERFGMPPAPGLRDVLAGRIAPQRAIRETGQDCLDAVIIGRGGDRSDPSLTVDAFRGLLHFLRGRYDLVFVDGSCWSGGAEIVSVGALSDAVYLVVPQHLADSEEIRELQHTIPQQGGRLRGCIHTQW